MDQSDTQNSPQKNDWKEREVGALWKKSGKSQNYFSGRVNLENYKDERYVNIVGFANKMKKDNANAPDVILYYSAPPASSLDLNDEDTSSSSSDETSDEAAPSSSNESTQEESEEVPF